MIFAYTHAGHKRLTISEWFALETWPHNCPRDPYHLHFLIQHNSREYRYGPALPPEAAQVSALVFVAKPFIK